MITFTPNPIVYPLTLDGLLIGGGCELPNEKPHLKTYITDISGFFGSPKKEGENTILLSVSDPNWNQNGNLVYSKSLDRDNRLR